MWIGILTASDYRFDYPQYASVGLMALAALFAVWTARGLRGRSRLSDAVPVALILNFGHGLSWVMGFQVGFALSIAAATGWFWCAARLHTGGGWRWAYRSAGFLFVLLGCGGFGLAYGPAAVGWFAFLARRAARLERRREATHFTVLAVAALGYFTAILLGTTSNIRTGFHPLAEPLEFLGGLGGFLAVGVGDWPISSFGWRPGAVSAAVGLGVAAVYLVGGLGLARRVVKERWEGIFPLAALLTVISTIAVGAAIARTRPDAMLDRYAAFSALGLIALFLAAAAAAPVASAARWWRVSVSGGGMLLAAGLFAANVSPGLAVGERFRESALPVLADLNAPLSPLLVGGRHGGTVSVRLGDSFAPILDWLRTSNVPPFSAMPPRSVVPRGPHFPGARGEGRLVRLGGSPPPRAVRTAAAAARGVRAPTAVRIGHRRAGATPAGMAGRGHRGERRSGGAGPRDGGGNGARLPVPGSSHRPPVDRRRRTPAPRTAGVRVAALAGAGPGTIIARMTPNAPVYTPRLWPPGEPCPYDDILDVRSPGEFAEDHIPGAVNLPVLNDAERAEVGTIFKQENPFLARRVGAAYISANIGRHLAAHLKEKPKGYRPFVYCWRGGMRSASIGHVLAQVGWRVTVLEGGYKRYRERVLGELSTAPLRYTFAIIAGATGSAKTRVLHRLAERGEQVLDLEGLANHRGSLLGNVGPQPSQKLFESHLIAAFDHFDPTRRVWVEGESSRIGSVQVPPALWARLRESAGVEIAMPTTGRVQHLLTEYRHFVENPNRLRALLAMMPHRVGKKQTGEWEAMIAAGRWEDFVASLLAVHYDPGYSASRAKNFPHADRPVPLAGPCPDAINATVSAMIGS